MAKTETLVLFFSLFFSVDVAFYAVLTSYSSIAYDANVLFNGVEMNIGNGQVVSNTFPQCKQTMGGNAVSLSHGEV